MIRTSQRTLYNIDLHLHQMLEKHYTPLENTTLNEKFGIMTTTPIPDGVYPALKYYAIGVGGDSVVDDNEDFNYSEHSPVDAALFKHIPFVMRNAVTNDLTEDERAKYRMRTLEFHNGTQYACYYLKVIQGYDLKPYFYSIRTLSEGISVSSPSLTILNTNKAEFLNPVPKSRKISYETSNNVDYITKLAKLNFSLLEDDIKELKDVLTILDLTNRNITEIGVCTGVDVPSKSYTEVIAAQIAFHLGVNMDIMMAFAQNESIQKSIEIGGSETFIT